MYRFVIFILFYCLPFMVEAALVAERTATYEGILDQPSDVAIDDIGRAYVLDGANQRVVVYTRNGEQDFIFGNDQLLTLPMGITIAHGQVFIADSGNHRIAIFSLRGEYLKAISLNAKLPPEPVSLAVYDDVVIWSDRRNHQVCKTEIASSETLACWGQRGESDGDFQFPFQISIDRDDYIHVVDVLNARVQMFNHRGRYFSEAGRFGLEAGELYRPNGLAFYQGDVLLVSDAYRGSVSLFRAGSYLGLLQDEKHEPLVFKAPVGLTVWSDQLYVVDALKHRVEVFRLRNSNDTHIAPPQRAVSGASQKNCSVCHLAWAPDYVSNEGFQDNVPPVATERMCYSCHHGVVIDSRLSIGRGEQHPDIHHQRQTEREQHAPDKKYDKLPKVFPLVDSTKNMRGKKQQLSCGSCHTPHTSNIEEAETLYSEHKNPWLRVLNNEGELCQLCHELKVDDVQRKEKKLTGINHPVGFFLKPPPDSQAEGYATSEKLHKGLPKLLSANGASLGQDKEMICQSCHQIHGGKNDALTPLDYEEGQMCAVCHDRQHAEDEKEARKKGIHPVNIELEEPVKIEGQEIKKVTCLTCHSIHDGEKGTAVLKFNDRDGKLCSYCHEEYDLVVNSDHDLRVTAKKYQNRFKHTPEQAGACGTCHTMHKGNPDIPFLYAGEYQAYEGDEPALARDRACLDCHRKKGSAEKVVVEHFSHPAKDLVLRSDEKIMPLVNAKNEFEEFGAIACVTCHELHRWQPKEAESQVELQNQPEEIEPVKNQDGNVLNSFLRRKGAKGTFCIDCHGLETRVKYKYYHDDLVRDQGIDYIE